MTGSWNSHRGDEWWFSGGLLKANGAFNSAPNMFEITPADSSVIQPRGLQGLLAKTFQQFSGVRIYIALDKPTRATLDSLAQSKNVVWQEFKQPYSLWAHILSVVPPN